MLKKILVPLLIFCTVLTAKVSAAEFEMVSYSSLVKLQWLADTGQPEAKKILKALKQGTLYDNKNLKDFDRLNKVNGVYQELNYAATVEYVRKHGYQNILDIGSGYSPRAVVFARDGRKYFGAELAAVAMSANEIMAKILTKEQFQNVTYDEVLIGDREEMLGAADEFNGKICILEDGLMMFLNGERTAEMFKLVKEILQKHGGCFITTDFVTKEYFQEIASALYGDEQSDWLYDETKAIYEELFDNPIFDDTFETQDDALEFLAAQGLKVRQVPLLTDTSKLYCLKTLNPQQIENIKKIAAESYLWVITAE